VTWSTRVGRAIYYRGKGAPWVEMFRPWITPVVVSGVGARYLGVSLWWALGLAIGIPVVIEIVAVLLGRAEHSSGATAEHYRIAAETDTYKRESLALLRDIRTGLARVETAVAALTSRIEPR
jgi:hypothetical protein